MTAGAILRRTTSSRLLEVAYGVAAIRPPTDSVAATARHCDPQPVIRLRAQAPDAVLTEPQARLVRFWLLEFLPAARCQVSYGPGITILVPDRNPDDLTEALRRQIEQVVGCPLIDDFRE